ncbi:MAG TPA: Ig-like domain-containing protein, partial [Myxococcales bacterium]|nr:Ig-like domain-containing protein [Myxococcales bacterium]
MKVKLPIALAAAAAGLASIAAGCGGLLIITEPDGGPPPCCDGGIPDSGSTDNGPPASSTTTLVALPDTTVVADGVTAVTLRVVVRDAAGHLLSGAGVSMSCDGTGNAFAPTSASGYTASDGSFQAALTSTRAEPKTVTVAVADFTLTQALTFIAGRPDPNTSSMVLAPTPPSTVTADGVQTAAIAATLRDAHGNIVAGNTVTFTATGSNNTFNPGSQVVATDAGGVARITLASTRAEPKTVVATVGSLFVMTRQVAFAPGSASAVTSTLTASPTQLVADGVARTSLTATVRDPNGNPIPGMSATFSATGGGNRFTPGSTATTNVDGVARVQLDSTVAETKTVTAVVAGLTLRTAVLFGVGSPTNGNSSISVQTPVVADGTASGQITVTVKDGTNNPISGAAVALTATGSVNTFSPAASGSTNASGVFQARLSSTVAETKSVTADVQSGAFFLTTSMDFLPGPASASNSRLDASPPQVPADGVTTTTLALSMEDVNGNKIPGLGVTLSSTGSANTFSRTTGTTDATGAFTATLKSTRAELKTVTATSGGVSVQTTVAFSPGPAVLANSSVTANPTNPVAGG